MDVKQIKAAIRAGILYREIDTDLNNLYISGEISKEEFDALSRQIEELENKEMSRGRTPDLVIEQVPSSREENTISKEEDDNVTALNTISETVAEPVVPVVENESSTEDTAEETREEPQQEGQPASENSASEEESREGTNKDAPQWVSDYRNYMMEWSARNPERRLQKFEKEEGSYKADFKDGVALNFSSPSNVAVKTADPESPKASDFDALIEIAKKSNQNIRLSDNMSDEFRKALIEACATADVKITNLSREDTELYLSFATKEEETTEQQDVVNDTEENVAAPVNEEPVNEEPEAPAEEAEPVVETETPIVSDSIEENEPIAMPESFSEETLKDNSEELFGDLPTADTVDEDKENDTDNLFNLDYTPSEKEQTADPFEILFNNTEDSAEETPEEPVVEEPKAENSETPAETAPSGEIAAEEEGFFKRTFKKLKNKLPVWMVGLGSVGAVVAPSCNTPTQKQGQTADGYEAFIDTTDNSSDTTYVATAADLRTAAADSASIAVPTEWNKDMKIGEDRFYVTMNSYENWEVAYRNAYKLQDVLQMDALVILSALRNDAAWTCSPDSKGYADYNSGGLAKYGLGDLGAAIKCGKTLNLEKLENYKILLRAGDNERLSINTHIMAELIPNYDKPNKHHHIDSKGYLIGDENNCSRLKIIYNCGKASDMRFSLRNCGCTNITDRVDQVIQQDTTPAPVVDTTTYVAPVEPVVVVDTVQEAPAPEVKKAKAPQAPKFVTVATTSNLGEAPMNGFMTTVANGANESQITKGTKSAAKRMSRQLKRAGIDAQTSEEFKNEVKAPNSSKEEAQEKAKQQQNYEWTVNNQNSRD